MVAMDDFSQTGEKNKPVIHRLDWPITGDDFNLQREKRKTLSHRLDWTIISDDFNLRGEKNKTVIHRLDWTMAGDDFKQRREKTAEKELSEMDETKIVNDKFIEFSKTYVENGSTIQDQKERLTIAVTAWNISYWDDEEKRQKYIQEFESYFKNSALRQKKVLDLLDLIKLKYEKYKEYPNQIIKHKLRVKGKQVLFELTVSEYNKNQRQ